MIHLFLPLKMIAKQPINIPAQVCHVPQIWQIIFQSMFSASGQGRVIYMLDQTAWAPVQYYTPELILKQIHKTGWEPILKQTQASISNHWCTISNGIELICSYLIVQRATFREFLQDCIIHKLKRREYLLEISFRNISTASQQTTRQERVQGMNIRLVHMPAVQW